MIRRSRPCHGCKCQRRGGAIGLDGFPEAEKRGFQIAVVPCDGGVVHVLFQGQPKAAPGASGWRNVQIAPGDPGGVYGDPGRNRHVPVFLDNAHILPHIAVANIRGRCAGGGIRPNAPQRPGQQRGQGGLGGDVRPFGGSEKLIRQLGNSDVLGGDLLVMIRLVSFSFADFKRLENAQRVGIADTHPALDHLVWVIRECSGQAHFLMRLLGALRIIPREDRLVRRVKKQEIHDFHLSRQYTVPVPVMVMLPVLGMMKDETKVKYCMMLVFPTAAVWRFRSIIRSPAGTVENVMVSVPSEYA